MSPTSREHFAAVVRTELVDLGLACLLIAAQADPALDTRAAQAELERLARSVDPRRPPVEALRGVLAGFTGDARDYADLRSSLLPEVLRRRAGLPILLSVVWLEVARRCGIPADGIRLPGHFVVRVGDNYVDNYVDPFAGGARLDVSGVPAPYLRPWDAAEWANASYGPTVGTCVEASRRCGPRTPTRPRQLTSMRPHCSTSARSSGCGSHRRATRPRSRRRWQRWRRRRRISCAMWSSGRLPPPPSIPARRD